MPNLQPIGQCYLFEVSHRDGTYFAESGFLPRGRDLFLTDAIAEASQHDDLVAVWELNPAEGGMRDVSEDIARAMLDAFEGEQDELPAFIADHLSDAEIGEHFAEIEYDRAYSRELASPYMTGRI
jgi:hypothetical protein